MTEFYTEDERYQAIINDLPGTITFEHQDISDVPAFANGITENRVDINPTGIPVYVNLQDNITAGAYIRQNEQIINAAASEFGIEANLLKATIYTEMARG